ncbi:7443_t:CDS:2 [Entrophospora sp. SA101]|nr:7443_t:CDS:2 [Entrophospora sp. SA101]
MFAYIIQAYHYIAKAISYLDDSKDPFETRDLVEVREIIEYVEINPLAFKLPSELIDKYVRIIKKFKKIHDELNESYLIEVNNYLEARKLDEPTKLLFNDMKKKLYKLEKVREDIGQICNEISSFKRFVDENTSHFIIINAIN